MYALNAELENAGKWIGERMKQRGSDSGDREKRISKKQKKTKNKNRAWGVGAKNLAFTAKKDCKEDFYIISLLLICVREIIAICNYKYCQK